LNETESSPSGRERTKKKEDGKEREVTKKGYINSKEKAALEGETVLVGERRPA